ncbi:essential meiotic structure-specific endonuclease subunit 2 [Homo sapiens]|uniref:Structure-specific endonuclease subunit EME2 n=1 Tax=Homo sapiens TaxID=9606 RepID=EME2_HUMAN|nr:probable crossover junction endonuclease EME2 [Homo sapiens]A4GXA9.3 RecName: Full=Probable crossover junction endonuclease EME2 [Homo sapiens]7F6L_B Chain B, Probable crossover junction endonuclease EME2 [Homo sapiens]ABO21766.1 endonuclease EME2 [Homo sapiens]KAI2576392.1 essential meiotic structure-specific endonuclease subunit 2 [Homo sapiens]KAI4052799.1 essential meiotic structure-specific endonuclease subunit 2 [Homo sapiens]|eukprot:NP_001244299.1 probable crossover junction endonuclease EME2 [Homo sapiens]
MARVGPGRAGVSCQGRGRGRGGSGQRRPPTWEISDSDAEDSAGSEAAARARDPAGERRAAAEALRLLRPEQVLKRLAVCVDTAILEDAGADVLMEALEALGCECRIEPQRPARSLRWTRASPDPCPRSLPPEVWAAGEQELLLLLEPEEFLQGVATLTQISGPTHWVPWISPETTARPHLAVIGLDAYLWSRQHVSRGTQQPESPKVAGAEVAVSWPEVEEALVLLQLWANLDVLLVASWQELSRHVCAVTKALAQYPLKQYRESQAFSFCTAGRWAAGEPVARDGAGLQAAWRRQIRQFSRVSPAVADAVVTAFPSPRLLQQALEACSTERERMGLLADLPVPPSEGGRPRRVGPDLSRRICLFLTTANPDLLLDLGS